MKLNEKLNKLSEKIRQVYVALRLKETPWYAKAVGGLTLAYALSPLDLIPDFIPFLGYLDDLIILPLLIALTIKLIPKEVWEKCELEAKSIWNNGKPVKWYYALPVVMIWGLVLLIIIRVVLS